MAASVAMLVLATAAATAPPVDLNLSLTCTGHSDAPTSSSALSFLARGGVTTHTAFGSRREEGRVLVRLAEGTGRVHLPRTLVTTVNSGGDDGWWTMSDLKVTDDVISGRLHLNIVNTPSVRIDRATGDIDLGGAYPFHGACEKASGNDRKF
jgi:hypothetical protein